MSPHTLGLAWDFFWWPESGKWYAFWSSFGACLTYFAIFAVVYRKLNCHAKGCWRVGLHHVEGTPYITCRSITPQAELRLTTYGTPTRSINDRHKTTGRTSLPRSRESVQGVSGDLESRA
jgi:hypothetical protein